MGQRISIGALAILTIVGLVFLDVAIAQEVAFARYTGQSLSGPLGDLLLRGSILPCFLVLMILRGAVEMNRLLRSKGTNPHTAFAYSMIVVMVLSPWLSAAGWLGRGSAQVEGLFWLIVWVAVSIIGTGVLTVARRNPTESLRDTGATLAMILYLGFLGSFAIQLRCGRDLPRDDGAWLLLITLLVTKASDIGAFLVGSLIGRHKLMPRISGGKTVEGAIGGLVFSVGVAVTLVWAFGALSAPGARSATVPLDGKMTLPTDTADPADLESERSLARLASLAEEAMRAFSAPSRIGGMGSYLRAIVFGIAMAVFGQLGDLFESCFKRDAGTKDSARLIPRFGGILDLIDSPLLTIPVAWFLFVVVWGLM